MAPAVQRCLCLAVALLLNVVPAMGARALRRTATAVELRSAARASRLRREVVLMKIRGAEVVGVLRSAADRLDEALLQTAAAAPSGANATTAGNASARLATPPKLSANRSSALKEQQEVLKGLLAHLKSSITRDNKEEGESKTHNQEMIERLKKRLDSDRARLNRSNISERERAMYTNDTKLEERELQYWTRGRDLHHGMYHANLKMTHGLMSRVRTVMQAYEEVLATGHLNPAMSKLLHSATQSIALPAAQHAAAPKAAASANATARGAQPAHNATARSAQPAHEPQPPAAKPKAK